MGKIDKLNFLIPPYIDGKNNVKCMSPQAGCARWCINEEIGLWNYKEGVIDIFNGHGTYLKCIDNISSYFIHGLKKGWEPYKNDLGNKFIYIRFITWYDKKTDILKNIKPININIDSLNNILIPFESDDDIILAYGIDYTIARVLKENIKIRFNFEKSNYYLQTFLFLI